MALNAITDNYLINKGFSGFFKKYRIGIYSTVIVNLLIIIFLLAYKIGTLDVSKDNFIFLNEYFDQLPDEQTLAQQQMVAQEQERENISAEVDEMLRNARGGTSISNAHYGTSVRNVAVNTEDAYGSNYTSSSVLRDAKGINNSVYEEARRLQEKMDASRRMVQDEQSTGVGSGSAGSSKSSSGNSGVSGAQPETYQGPSVLSYTLQGRRAMSMPIPAYKCENGGDVTVRIVVNPQGYVIEATIDMQHSSSDPALHHEAKNTAMRSRFVASTTAPAKQEGTIVYRFIAQ